MSSSSSSTPSQDWRSSKPAISAGGGAGGGSGGGDETDPSWRANAKGDFPKPPVSAASSTSSSSSEKSAAKASDGKTPTTTYLADNASFADSLSLTFESVVMGALLMWITRRSRATPSFQNLLNWINLLGPLLLIISESKRGAEAKREPLLAALVGVNITWFARRLLDGKETGPWEIQTPFNASTSPSSTNIFNPDSNEALVSCVISFLTHLRLYLHAVSHPKSLERVTVLVGTVLGMTMARRV